MSSDASLRGDRAHAVAWRAGHLSLVLAALLTVAASAAAALIPSGDRAAGDSTTVLVSATNTGRQGDAVSRHAAISTSGRYVVFSSSATNLVPRDTNRSADVFRRDLVTGTIRRLSVSSTGRQANGDSMQPVISRDGSVVLFASEATNLVRRDTNGVIDVFAWTSGELRRLSVAGDGDQSNGASVQPAISADGLVAAFESAASNLVQSDTNGRIDVYRRSVAGPASTLERVSVDSSGEEGKRASFGPALDANGEVVAFMSEASNLVTGDDNGARDVFVRTEEGSTLRVSVGEAAEQANGDSVDPALSANGRFVSFTSEATNLGADDDNASSDVFVHDRSTDEIVDVSVRGGSDFVRGDSDDAAISSDGLRVTFVSAARLTTGDSNEVADIFVADLGTGQLRLVSSGRRGRANAASGDPTISAPGTRIAFVSSATNLVPNDRNGAPDVFAWTDS